MNFIMKKLRRLILAVLIILFCNLEFVRLIVFREGVYTFHSEDYSFAFKVITFKGRDFELMMKGFERSEAKANGIKLCRDFMLNPLKFWNWYFYLTDPLCKIPYCKPRPTKVTPTH